MAANDALGSAQIFRTKIKYISSKEEGQKGEAKDTPRGQRTLERRALQEAKAPMKK